MRARLFWIGERRARLGLALALVAACKEAPAPPSPTAPADCTKVAEIVTTFELAPGVDAKTRAAAVARHADTCHAAGVTVAEANCMVAAKDTWAVKACAPKMFGLLPPAGGSGSASADCKSVVLRMRQKIVDELPGDAGSAGLAMVERMLVVMEAACLEDGWPATYRECLTSARDKAEYDKCEDLPTELQTKLGERLKPIIRSQ